MEESGTGGKKFSIIISNKYNSSYDNNNNNGSIINNNNNKFGDKMLVRRKRGERDLNEVSSSMKSRLANPAYPSKKLKEEQTSNRAQFPKISYFSRWFSS